MVAGISFAGCWSLGAATAGAATAGARSAGHAAATAATPPTVSFVVFIESVVCGRVGVTAGGVRPFVHVPQWDVRLTLIGRVLLRAGAWLRRRVPRAAAVGPSHICTPLPPGRVGERLVIVGAHPPPASGARDGRPQRLEQLAEPRSHHVNAASSVCVVKATVSKY